MMGTSKKNRMSVGEILIELSAQLEKLSETPWQDAGVLLAHLMDKPRAWVLAHPEEHMERGKLPGLDEILARLERNEPLPYILGSWEFYNLRFEVNPDVLIPRPETELLVDKAIAWLGQERREDSLQQVLDIGTGSGCIAIALAVNTPNTHFTASDISQAALATAARNAVKNTISNRITFVESDLFSHPLMKGPFSLIVSNPPYIPTHSLPALQVARWEPSLALDGGRDGLALIRNILKGAPARLAPGGMVLMEIGAGQGSEVAAFALGAFPGAAIQVLPDLAGHDRLLEIRT